MATRKNAVPNPALKNNNTGWGGGSTPTRVTGLTGLPRTTGAHYSANSYAALPAATVGAGETWTLSCYFQNNTGSSLGTKTVYFVCKKPGDDFTITTSVALPTGTTRIEITGTTLTGTTGLYMLIDSFGANNGAGVEITAALYEKVAGPADTYFDGDTASAVWDGTDGNSSSTLTTGGSDTVVPDPNSGGVGANGTSDGRALGDSSGGASPGGQADGRALGDASGSSGSAGAGDGLTLGDASGGTGAGSSGDGRALGTEPGGAGTGGSGEGRALGDVSGGVGASGSADSSASASVVQDGSGGSGVGGSQGGTAIGTVSGGVGAGGSPDTVSGPVAIQDRSGGVGAGGQSEVLASEVVHDVLAMPVLLSALACLQDELNKVTKPPAIYTVRPGDSFEAQADPWIGSECCAGVAWVREVNQYQTDTSVWPELMSQGQNSGCGPDSWGVVFEVGVSRCVPVAADYRGGVVPPDMWLAAAIEQADDQAALRRVLCCLRALYDSSDVVSGQINPLPMQGGCGGSVMQVTVRRDACDC